MAFGPTRNNRGAGNSGEQGVQFRLSDAQRISNAVTWVEGQRKGRRPSELPRAAGGGGGQQEEEIVEAVFEGAWPKNQFKVVSFVADTSATASVQNTVGSLPPGPSRRAWIHATQLKLISAEC